MRRRGGTRTGQAIHKLSSQSKLWDFGGPSRPFDRPQHAPCGHLQPLAGSILHRGGVDRGTQLCHDYLAGCLCPSQRAACGVRRQIHHGDRCLFHVGIPHRAELCAGAGFPLRRYGRLDCDVCGLGIPRGPLFYPVPQRAVAPAAPSKTGCWAIADSPTCLGPYL